MKRAYLNYFLMGIFIFLLLAGVSSYSVNAEASLLEPYRIKNIFYRNVQNNYIQKDTDSYWIEYSPKEEPFPLRGQMRWAGTNGKED